MRNRIVALCPGVLVSVSAGAAPVVDAVTWPKKRAERQVRIGDSVWLRVSNLGELRALEAKTNKPVTLWIDGRDT